MDLEEEQQEQDPEPEPIPKRIKPKPRVILPREQVTEKLAYATEAYGTPVNHVTPSSSRHRDALLKLRKSARQFHKYY